MCSCGCNTCETKAPLLTEGVLFEQPISENLLYHIKNGKPITENTFRYGSDAFINLWKEARTLYSRDILNVGEEDEHIILETHLGEYGMFEGDRVPLDMPMLEEDVNLKEVSIKSSNVRDLIKRLYNDSNLVNFLEFKDFRNALKFIKNASMEEWYDLMKDVSTYESSLTEAKYHGENVELGKPKRGGTKKYYVYVMNPKTKKVKKVSFGGTTGLNVKIDDPKARHSFAARHKCAQEKNKLSPNYWGCHIGRYWKSLGGAKNFSGYW